MLWISLQYYASFSRDLTKLRPFSHSLATQSRLPGGPPDATAFPDLTPGEALRQRVRAGSDPPFLFPLVMDTLGVGFD